MARFRNNEHQVVAETIYDRAGLKIDRVQRFDQTALLPGLDRWRAWSFRITLSGTRYIRYADRSYTLAPNTVAWHSPLKEVVKTRCLPGTGSDTTIVSFSSQRWAAFLEQAERFRERTTSLLAEHPAQPVLALQSAPPQLLHVLRQLIVLSKAGHAPALALDNACTLLLQLLGEMQFGASAQCQDQERRQRVELAQGRMVARLMRPPSLEQVARELNISSRQLQRDFVAFTGLTPIRYLNVVRLSEANALLAETSLPIAQIAALLGYTSPAHFSAAFRQAYHCSPSEVRDLEG
jgi:AraC-like DNA-binding protein